MVWFGLHSNMAKLQRINQSLQVTVHIQIHALTHSTSSMDYSLPRLCTKFGKRAFSHADPATWNALPDHIRTVADPVKFQKLLKSHHFSQVFKKKHLLTFCVFAFG